jgi:Arc/MetJ family transcription regulator
VVVTARKGIIILEAVGQFKAEFGSRGNPGQDGPGEGIPLTRMYKICILIHMRTTLNIEDRLIDEAARLTGVTEKTALVRMGLTALIAREGARRLADLGGSEKNLRRPPRRRRDRTA